jgi:hypothetical protein
MIRWGASEELRKSQRKPQRNVHCKSDYLWLLHTLFPLLLHSRGVFLYVNYRRGAGVLEYIH